MGCYNVIFIHPPKTAGFSIGQSLYRNGHLPRDFQVSHRLARHVMQKYKDQSRVVLGVVRNPYDRVWSIFEYFERARGFEEFVLNYPPTGDRRYLGCFEYLSDGKDKLLTTDIIRFENLSTDFELFCAKYNIKCDKLLHLHQNKMKRPRPSYTPAMREIIERVFRRDLDVFEYTYEDYLKLT